MTSIRFALFVRLALLDCALQHVFGIICNSNEITTNTGVFYIPYIELLFGPIS